MYVVALQRCQENNTTVAHVRDLNTIIRRLQTSPQKLSYGKLAPDTTFVCVTDAAFKKEDDTGHALKGTLLLRVPAGKLAASSCHVIDFQTKRIRFVTRSTFAAELFSVCDACDHSILLRQIAHEITHGPLSGEDARRLREGKLQSSVLIDVVIDAMSVYAAITATHIKIPSEKSLLSHVQYVRELLDYRTIHSIYWQDTRDLVADALTKGSCSRDNLCACMNGSLGMSHEVKQWKPLLASSSEDSPEAISPPEQIV